MLHKLEVSSQSQMDTIDTTQNSHSDIDCNCGCKEGACVCTNCTNQSCECGVCKMKIDNDRVAAESSVA